MQVSYGCELRQKETVNGANVPHGNERKRENKRLVAHTSQFVTRFASHNNDGRQSFKTIYLFPEDLFHRHEHSFVPLDKNCLDSVLQFWQHSPRLAMAETLDEQVPIRDYFRRCCLETPRPRLPPPTPSVQ